MKITGLILFLGLTTVTALAQTNQTWEVCRNPVRVFSGPAMVNLRPLFDWWAQQPQTNRADTNQVAAAGDRPLTAWARVTGTKVATAGSSWVLNAVIYTSPSERTNARIILNNPPVTEEQTFYLLRTQLSQARQQLASLRQQYASNTNAAAKAEARVLAYARTTLKVRTLGMNSYERVAAQKRAAAADDLNQLDQLELARAQIEEQLKTIPAVNGTYHVDWFALEVGRSRQGVPIYDLGLVSPTPP
jgi:hypothetical protein